MKRRTTYASDLYSLGVTGLYLLTGASPWDLESEENFGQWQWREFAQAQGTVLEASFADFIDRLIAKSLSDRFHSAAEALQVLDPQPVKKTAPPPPMDLSAVVVEPPKLDRSQDLVLNRSQIVQWNIDLVPLESETGVNFGFETLRDLLKAKKWQEADYQTYLLMMTIVRCDWIQSEEVLNFSYKDLKTIDRLWLNASQGRYGFSVQKEIYERCGAKLDGKYPGSAMLQKFGANIGWFVNNQWLDRNSPLNWSISIPGHLPLRGWLFLLSYQDL